MNNFPSDFEFVGIVVFPNRSFFAMKEIFSFWDIDFIMPTSFLVLYLILFIELVVELYF